MLKVLECAGDNQMRDDELILHVQTWCEEDTNNNNNLNDDKGVGIILTDLLENCCSDTF